MLRPEKLEAGRRVVARRVAVIYFFAAAAWIVLSDLALLSFNVDLGGLVGGSIAKGLLFCAVTALILYFSLTRILRTRDVAPAGRLAASDGGPFWKSGPAAVFASSAALAVALAIGMFALDAREERATARQTLLAILELKAQQIEQWLEVRRQVARSYGGARALREQVSSIRAGDAPSARADLEARLEAIRTALHIDAVLLLDDGAGYAAGAGEKRYVRISRQLVEQAKRTIATGEPVPQFLHRDSVDGEDLVLVDFIVPLRDLTAGGGTGGAMVLRENARASFFKIVQHWPTASASAECALVRRDGGQIQYLSDLKHLADTALKLRRPLSEARLPASQALRNASPATLDGIDYRGIEVVAAAHAIAGTDWLLIAKIDHDEVLAPARRTAAIWLTAILGIMLLGALGVGALWRERLAVVAMRERASAAERRRAEVQLHASEERLRRYFDQGLVGMAITMPDKSFAEVNDRICSILGYSRAELTRMDWASITHPEDLAADVALFERMGAGEIDSYSLDKRFIRKDGLVVDTTISIGCLRKPDRSIDYIVGLMQDISDRKRAEAQIVKLARFKAALSAVSRAITHAEEPSALYREVCRVCVEDAGFPLAWVGILDAASGQVRRVAVTGAAADYVEGINVSVRDEPEGRGPTGMAAREGRTQICDDFETDERVAPWRDRARRFGIRSSTAVPFHVPENGAGVLTVYSTEPAFFDSEIAALLEVMARDLSFGLDALARRGELRASEMRFRALMEQSIAAVYVIQDGKIVYVNPRTREIFGYAPDEPFDPDPLAHVAGSEREKVAEQMARRLGDEPEGTSSITALRRDGTPFTLGLHAKRALYGGKVAIITIAQDITEKARIDKERVRRLERYQTQGEALSAVSLSEALVEGKVTTLARQITEAACRAAGVERANVWLFNEDETELRCIDLYEATPARHSSGAVLAQAQFRGEFAALKESAYVNADEPLVDPRTAGYAESYLKPHGITSMLDAAIRFSGRHLGVLCLEHVNRAHHWEHDEISFTCQLADKLAIAIVNRSRRKARAALERANRALRTVSAGNEALVRATDEASLLAQMCRAIVETGGYAVAAVRYVDADGALVPQASAGATPDELRLVPRAATGALMPADGKPVLLREFDGDATLDSWRASSRRDELKSALVLPLQHGDATPAYGMLHIAAAEADAFGDEEVKLLRELSRDLAYGISALRVRAEQGLSAARLRRSLEESIGAIAATVEMRDPYTAGHEKRVAELAAAIAREMGLPAFTVEGIHFGALIHDVGKIQVPAEILSKPTRLMPIEYELIKAHPQAGYDILKGIEFPWPIAQMVLQHHERLDGSGYPQGLKGDAILLEARVLAVADVVEAMSSHRPYRPGLGIDKALAEIERGRASVYDPQVVDACLRLFREKKYELPA